MRNLIRYVKFRIKMIVSIWKYHIPWVDFSKWSNTPTAFILKRVFSPNKPQSMVTLQVSGCNKMPYTFITHWKAQRRTNWTLCDWRRADSALPHGRDAWAYESSGVQYMWTWIDCTHRLQWQNGSSVNAPHGRFHDGKSQNEFHLHSKVPKGEVNSRTRCCGIPKKRTWASTLIVVRTKSTGPRNVLLLTTMKAILGV